MNAQPFQKQLEEKERELRMNRKSLIDQALDGGEIEVRDSADSATSTQATSQALEQEQLESGTLEEVTDALQRIANGSYGKCMRCGRQIPEERLRAVPWATLCVEDQEIQERESNREERHLTL